MAKSLSRQTLTIAIGTSVQSVLAQVALNVALVRVLGSQEDFGLFRQVWLILNTAHPIFLIGVHFSIYYYLPRLPRDRERAFVLRSTFILLVSGAVLAAGLYSLAPFLADLFSNPRLLSLFRAVSLYPLFTTPSALLFHFLIATDRASRATVYNIVLFTAQSVLIVCLVVVGMSLASVFLLLAAYAGLRFLFVAAETTRLSCGSWRASLPVGLRTQLRYAIPVGITATVTIASSRIDKFVVSSFMDSATYGLYSVGAIEFPTIVLISTAAATVMRPKISQLHHAGRVDEISVFWSGVFRKLLLIMAPMAAYLAVFAPQVISFLYTSDYVAATEIFRVYLLLTISRVVLFEPVLASMGRTRVVFLGGVGFLAVDVILNVLFVRGMGILGPPWATALATILLAGFYAWHGRQTLGAPWSRLISVGLLLRVCPIAGLAALAAVPVKELGWSNLVTLIAGAVVLGVVYAAAAYATRTITREDFRLLASLVPTFRSRPSR